MWGAHAPDAETKAQRGKDVHRGLVNQLTCLLHGFLPVSKGAQSPPRARPTARQSIAASSCVERGVRNQGQVEGPQMCPLLRSHSIKWGCNNKNNNVPLMTSVQLMR